MRKQLARYSLRLIVLFASLPLATLPAPGQNESPNEAPPEHVAAPPEDAEVTESGLAHKLLRAGTGETHPRLTDRVKVHYTGWTTDGKVFDNSYLRDKPSIFPLTRVIAGWMEALPLMVEGEQRRFWIPAELAYEGTPGRPQGMLVFDIELLEILVAPAPPPPRVMPQRPPTPPNVAAPPPEAESLNSGLAWIVLQEGHGERNPKIRNEVVVHYTGWTTDGKMFDSSIMRGKPATFRVDQVIRGWTDGLRLMVEGEKRRFWIPEKLAYRGQRGRPKGMLVFDVELIEIK